MQEEDQNISCETSASLAIERHVSSRRSLSERIDQWET